MHLSINTQKEERNVSKAFVPKFYKLYLKGSCRPCRPLKRPVQLWFSSRTRALDERVALVATEETCVYPLTILVPPWLSSCSSLSNTGIWIMAFPAKWLTAAQQMPLRHVTHQQLRKFCQKAFGSDAKFLGHESINIRWFPHKLTSPSCPNKWQYTSWRPIHSCFSSCFALHHVVPMRRGNNSG